MNKYARFTYLKGTIMIYYVLSAQIHLDPTLTEQWGNETDFRHKGLHTKYEISAKQHCDIKRALALTRIPYNKKVFQ